MDRETAKRAGVLAELIRDLEARIKDRNVIWVLSDEDVWAAVAPLAEKKLAELKKELEELK